ncbi:hypothetical protein TURU_057862 [Turdus rufiventris]|nr:hypothetical protein TURU_057862 [Turdus rufiventris]
MRRLKPSGRVAGERLQSVEKSTGLSGAEEAELETIKKHKQELLDDIKKLKEEIAEVFAEIERFQEENQEADNNPGEQTRQVE